MLPRHSGAARSAEPGIQGDMAPRVALDSGFAPSRAAE